MRFLLSSKTKSNTPNSLTVKNSTITDINDIAEEFNYHFATIGKSLAFSIINKDKLPTFYLKNPNTNSIYLQPTLTHEVIALINLLNLNKANGYDNIDPYFLKIASPIIAFLLSLIFNHSISLGIFPNKLKLAKVIPVYKKGSAVQLNNYRLNNHSYLLYQKYLNAYYIIGCYPSLTVITYLFLFNMNSDINVALFILF